MKKVILSCLLLMTSCTLGGGPDGGGPRATIRPGGTLPVAWTTPATVDPSRTSDPSGIFLLKQICDTLVSFTPATGALTPGIAESWTIAPDAKKVTFKLRDNVKFQNGRVVVAEDFVYSISRFVHPTTGSAQYYFFDKVVGYQDVRAARSASLSGLRPLDARTLEVELSEPFAEIVAVMAHPAAGAAIPKEEVDKAPDAFAIRPICTGPYLMKEAWVAGQDITLLRFSEYTGVRKGFVSQIQMKSVPDDEAAFKLLLDKKVRVARTPIARLADAHRSDIPLVSGSDGHFAYLGFPLNKPPYDNKDLRLALSTAINREGLIKDLLARTRDVPKGFLPPASGPASRLAACPDVLTKKALPRAARASLTASGVPSPTPVIYFNSGGGHEKWIARVISDWSTNLGVAATAQAEPKPFREHLDFLVDGLADGPFRLAWAVNYPSPEAMLKPVFAAGSLDNYMRYASQPFEDALKAARATVDATARRDAYAAAAKILCTDMPVAPMWFGRNHVAYGSAEGPESSRALDVFGDPSLRELGSNP